MSKTALIFGASGVTGWAFVNEILHDYPKKGTWKKVHALTNRPLKQIDSLWPADERLNIVSGIDLLKGSQEELDATIKEQVKGVEEVTHVYYLAYKASSDLTQELNDAVSMFQRSTTSIDKLSPALEFLVLQTGAKMYGCHLLDAHPTDYLQVPHKESQPRLKPPYHDTLFYHPQLDFLSSFATTKSWNWMDTRPDIIIGFIPNQNFYSLANSLGFYLALFREVEGKGKECSFPGSLKAWKAKSQDSSSDMIARQTLHLSLTLPISVKGEGFNVADYKEPLTWETKWPIVCSFFGLIGTPPPDSTKGEGEANEVRTYIKKYIGRWEEVERRDGLRVGLADSERVYKGFEYFLLTQFDFDRQYDMGKVYGPVGGFKEERGPAQSWGGVFERMRAAKMIPTYKD